jgi:hypothetical protein
MIHAEKKRKIEMVHMTKDPVYNGGSQSTHATNCPVRVLFAEEDSLVYLSRKIEHLVVSMIVREAGYHWFEWFVFFVSSMWNQFEKERSDLNLLLVGERYEDALNIDDAELALSGWGIYSNVPPTAKKGDVYITL